MLRQRGILYLGVLLLVVIMGVVLASAGVIWSQFEQREKERELLFIGDQFRRAIGLYYEHTPGIIKAYPKSLNDLLEDRRYITMQRYLRQIYRDPMTGNTDWGLVTQGDGSIQGVYSLSTASPIKSRGFKNQDGPFNLATSYADWKFIYVPTTPIPTLSAAPAHSPQ